jgi:hypothetical protein
MSEDVEAESEDGMTGRSGLEEVNVCGTRRETVSVISTIFCIFSIPSASIIITKSLNY